MTVVPARLAMNVAHTLATPLAGHCRVGGSARSLTHPGNVAPMTAPHVAAHPCVAASGRALTHIEVRSHTSSAAPSAGLAKRGTTEFV